MPLTGQTSDRGGVEPYLAEVLGRTRGALGPDLLGVYLIGSLALGGYVPGRSDIDATVVTAEPAERRKLERLVGALAHPGLRCPAPKLELVVYAMAAVAGDDPSLEWSLNLNTGPEVGLLVSYDPTEEPPHWFVLDMAMARDHARRLAGPPPRSVFGTVPRARVLAALAESLRWQDEHDAPGVQSVLNASRALRFALEGRWSSKDEAARWAQRHGPDRNLVASASAARHGSADPLDPARIRVFLASVRETVDRALDA